MRVLLVEDNHDLRRLLARAIRACRCEVREAADAFEALDALAAPAPPPDLVVTDVMMPGTGGIEMIRRLRGLPDRSAVPVVVITADDAPETAARARAAGACEVLVKPLDLGEFSARFFGRP